MTWTEDVITRKPKTLKVRLPEYGVPYPTRQQVREHGSWTGLTGRDLLRDYLVEEFGASLKALFQPRGLEIARHTDVRYTRMARVTVPEHPHRIYFVFPTAGQPHVMTLPTRKRTWQITGVVAGALPLLALVVQLIA